MTTAWYRRRVPSRRLAAVAAALALLLAACSSAAPSASRAAPTTVRCSNNPTTDTQALQAAEKAAEKGAGTVTIAAGTCALDARIAIGRAVTIEGQGGAQSATAPATVIVQHARTNIFQVTGTGVTVEWLVLDTATYNASGPVKKDPDPAVLFSNARNTSVTHVTAVAGSGFGMRLVGPNPCYNDTSTGDRVSVVAVTTTGTGGFAAIDISCQNGASVSDVTVHGGTIALFEDRNTTLTGERFTPGPRAKMCAPPWFVTGPTSGITVTNVTSAGGGGIVHQPASGITVAGQTVTNLACR